MPEGFLAALNYFYTECCQSLIYSDEELQE